VPQRGPGTGRGRRRDAALDAAILDAAIDILASDGYARLTMELVAARARVGKASLYLRWPTRDALVAAALERRSGVVPGVADTGGLASDVRALLRALLAGYAGAGQAVAAVAGELASNPELAAAWRRRMTATLWARMRAIVERAVARGELPHDSDVELLSMLPLTLLQNWRVEHAQGPDDAAVERIVKQFFTPPPTDQPGRLVDVGPSPARR
jgi:AcrR family transcriptional regulator